MNANATPASIFVKHAFVAPLLFGMGILGVRHGDADIVSGEPDLH
jgi:hypothetical protein